MSSTAVSLADLLRRRNVDADGTTSASNAAEATGSADETQGSAAAGAVEADAYDAAEQMVWAETAESLAHDVEYWQRLNSAAYDGEDIYDCVADEWEQTYCRVSGKRERPARVVPRRQLPESTTSAPGDEQQSGATTAFAATSSPVTSPSAAVPVSPPALPHAAAADFDPAAVLEAVNAYDAKLRVELGGASRIPTMSEREVAALVAGYEHMMATLLGDETLKRRYGFIDGEVGEMRFGGSVPSYFANVTGQSIFCRKALSIAGLRNLISFGPLIYRQLEAKQFAGRPDAYSGDTGLALMRRVTGNVVDLDTTVLRCTDSATLNIVNLMNRHKGMPTYGSAAEFAASAQAEEIALNSALLAIDDFAKRLKLTTPAAQQGRNIAASQITRPLPVARSNTERGHAPVWRYENAGQLSFHANVPTMDDVIGALLKAPFHCVRHWAAIHSGAYADDSTPPAAAASGKAGSATVVAPRAKIDAFFEDCVVDSCFNMKHRAVELFGEALEKEGTIEDVLQKAQMVNQHLFSADLFDSDNATRDKEIEIMAGIAVGRVGRDPKTKLMRKITLSDVAQWVRST